MSPVGYRTMDGIDFNDIWYGGGAGIAGAVDLYREVDLPIIRSLALPWPETIFKYGISEKNGFQPLSSGQRPDRKNVEIATVYPIVGKHGYGVGTDLDTLLRGTGREIMMDVGRPLKEDPEFVLMQMLKKMMTDPSTSNAGYGFYNGQFAAEEKLTTPPRFQQNTFSAAHTHYYRTGSATISLQDLTAAKQTIRHHGHNGPLAAFINSAERQALENLALFTGNIIRSPVSDAVAVMGFNETFELVGIAFHVTEMVPAGYVLIVEYSGVEEYRPLIMFEPPNMKGLRLHPGPQNDYPLIESYFDRWLGFKVFQRGAGVCFQLATAGSYTNPTFNE